MAKVNRCRRADAAANAARCVHVVAASPRRGASAAVARANANHGFGYQSGVKHALSRQRTTWASQYAKSHVK
jgi:hypothetical protein